MSTSGATISADVPLPLPSAPSIKVSENITLQPALSKLGRGPGLILLVDKSIPLEAVNESLDPAPLQKWAEEGYTVAQIDISDTGNLAADLREAYNALFDLPQYNGNVKFGLISESRFECRGKRTDKPSQHIYREKTLGS